jgi:hypothetical protein
VLAHSLQSGVRAIGLVKPVADLGVVEPALDEQKVILAERAQAVFCPGGRGRTSLVIAAVQRLPFVAENGHDYGVAEAAVQRRCWRRRPSRTKPTFS